MSTTLVIRFIHSAGIVGDLIDFVTAGYLDHVEFGLPDGTWLGAHSSGGVRVRPADYCKPTVDLRYGLDLPDEQYSKIMNFAISQIGKPYDFDDIGGRLLNSGWHTADNKKWICSELVPAACTAGDLFLLNVLPGFSYRIDPKMLHLSPQLIGKLYYREPKLAAVPAMRLEEI